MKSGDHIYVDIEETRKHGIYCGKDLVVYWSTLEDGSQGVVCSLLVDFCQGQEPGVRKYAYRCNSRDRVSARINKRRKEASPKYSFANNKEFAIYCKTGLKVGDHIYTDYGDVFHHGIYCGDELVIHFGKGYKVKEQSLQKFVCHRKYRKILVLKYKHSYSPARVIRRARRRLGQKNYNLLFNNCEHFASWCKIGKSRSKQIEKLDRAVPKHIGHHMRKQFRNMGLRLLG